MLLQQRHRIAVECHPQSRRNFETLHEISADAGQLTCVLRFQQNVPAPACLYPLDWTRCWPDHRDIATRMTAKQVSDPVSRFCSEISSRARIGPAHHDV